MAYKLIQMPAARIPDAYDLSPYTQYQFLRPHWAAMLELLFYTMALEFRRPAVLPVIYDCSTWDGDTPPKRHPGNAHDGGDDFDITYGMVQMNENYNVGPLKNTSVGPMINGFPIHLDVPYQAAFYTRLGMLDLQYGGLVQNAACDPAVEQAVDRHLGTFSVRDVTKARARSITNKSRDISWHAYHGNHTHIRMLQFNEKIEKELETEFKFDIAELLNKHGVGL